MKRSRSHLIHAAALSAALLGGWMTAPAWSAGHLGGQDARATDATARVGYASQPMCTVRKVARPGHPGKAQRTVGRDRASCESQSNEKV